MVSAVEAGGGLAAGYRGDDAYLVAGLGGGVHSLQEPDVFTVEVDVDEIAQLARLVHESFLDAGVGLLHAVDELGDGGSFPPPPCPDCL